MRTLVHCFLVFSCMLFMGGCAKVQTGTRVTCKNCHKVIQDTVHEVTVPFWQAQQFSISTEETYCKECGDQLVVYKTHYLCKKCGQEFKTEEFSAPRREERSDQTVSNQYCETCGNESVSYKVVHLLRIPLKVDTCSAQS